jgi:hypothetical protein
MQKFSVDSVQCLAALGEELKAKVDGFMGQLRGCAQGHSDSNRRVIQKNLQRVGQDQARLQGVRCGMETLLLENDPFRFIQARRTHPAAHIDVQLVFIRTNPREMNPSRFQGGTLTT